MACDCGIYFNRDDICKRLSCYYGFIPYRKNEEKCCDQR